MDRRIDRLQRLSCERDDCFAMGGGLPATELFPRAALGRAFVAAVNRPTCEALQYGWPEGNRGLRAWIASRLRARGADVGEDDVIVTSGAQQALAIAAEVLLAAGGPTAAARVDVDPESYPAALDLFRARGAEIVAFTRALRVVARRAEDRPDAPAACAYVMPGVANPRGLGMPDDHRAALLASRVPIIADEAYAELRFDGATPRPLLADARDRTWHVGTFSKTLAPGLRVGFLVPPRPRRDDALRVKHDTDLQAGGLAQSVLEEFLAHDDFEARLARARRFYARRAHRLVRALRRRFPSFRLREPEGGFSVFVDTDEEGDDAELLAVATEHGVSFDPGRLFRPDERSSPVAMRLCFSATPGRRLDEAVERLARAWDAWRASRRRSRVTAT